MLVQNGRGRVGPGGGGVTESYQHTATWGGRGGGLLGVSPIHCAIWGGGVLGVSQIHRATGWKGGGRARRCFTDTPRHGGGKGGRGVSSLVFHQCAAPRHGMGGGGVSKTLCHAVPRRAADYAVHLLSPPSSSYGRPFRSPILLSLCASCAPSSLNALGPTVRHEGMGEGKNLLESVPRHFCAIHHGYRGGGGGLVP